MALRKIIMLRHDRVDLVTMDALQLLFPDDDLQYIRTDPTDHLEHDRLCLEHNADLVLLPREKPIPSTAMARGVPHVTVLPSGELKKLISINPVFGDI